MTDNKCSICDNEFKKLSQVVQCGFCSFEACSKCYEQYLLTQNNPHCMNNDCKKEWTRQFMSLHFTKSFINNKYKKHREKILLDQEKALLPATQLVIEEKMRIRKIEKTIEV